MLDVMMDSQHDTGMRRHALSVPSCFLFKTNFFDLTHHTAFPLQWCLCFLTLRICQRYSAAASSPFSTSSPDDEDPQCISCSYALMGLPRYLPGVHHA